MFNENDLESVYVVGQEITDRNLGETEESDPEHDHRCTKTPRLISYERDKSHLYEINLPK